MAQKIIITNKADNVIVSIADTAKDVDNGLQVWLADGSTYIIACMDSCTRYDGVETADSIVDGKYCYDTANGFTQNPNYRVAVNPQTDIPAMQKLIDNQAATISAQAASISALQAAVAASLGV